MPSGRLFGCLAVVALAACLLAVEGCGSDGASTVSTGETGASRPNIPLPLSEATVQSYKAGSPQRTAIEWWRAIQLNDPEAARSLYADPPIPADLAGQFNYVVGRLAGTVKVAAVKPKGKQTVVAVDWDAPRVRPRQVTMRMERLDGEWKIVTARFLDLLVLQMQRAEAASSKTG